MVKTDKEGSNGAGRVLALFVEDNRARYVAQLFATLSVVIWSWPTIVALHERWVGTAVVQGYLIVALTLFLVAKRVHRASASISSSSKAGFAALVLCAMVILASRTAGVTSVPQMLFPVTIFCVYWSTAGWKKARWMVAPLLYFYFALPVWQIPESLGLPILPVNEALRVVTTSVVSVLIGLFGIPAFIEGAFIHIPSGIFEVAEGCSGKVYLIVGLELSIFYAIAYIRSWTSGFVVVAVTAALSLVANWIRILLLVLIGFFSEMRSSLVSDHDVFGWCIYIFVVAGLLWLSSKLEHGSFVRAEYLGEDSLASRRNSTSSSMMYIAIIALSSGAIAVERKVTSVSLSAQSSMEITIPVFNGWIDVGPWEGQTRPILVGVDMQEAIWVNDSRRSVGIYVGHYASQKQEDELIHYDNAIEGSAGFVESQRQVRVSATTDPYSGVLTELLIVEDDSRRLVWYSMRVAGDMASTPLQAKILQLKGVLLGRSDAQVVVLTSFCEPDCDFARQTLEEILPVALPQIYEMLDSASAQAI